MFSEAGKNMKNTAIRAALTAAIVGAVALSGCANLNTDVQAMNAGGDWQGERTYTLARTPLQEASEDHTQYEASVRAELGKYGFAEVPVTDVPVAEEAVAGARVADVPVAGTAVTKAPVANVPGQGARYLLSIAYETRPATIGVAAGGCARDGDKACAANNGGTPASFAWFGRRSYQHALTLRFFDRSNGREVYKVSAISEDHDAEPLHAIPYLVKSALAQFPFDGHPDWRVKLHTDEAGGAPQVISVKPVQP